MPNGGLHRAVSLALAILCVSQALFAAEKLYIGPDGGSWDVATNWFPAGVPDANSAVSISNSWVVVPQAVTLASLHQVGGAITFGGTNRSVRAQYVANTNSTASFGLSLSGDLVTSGDLSVGGHNANSAPVFHVGGDFTAHDGASVVVFAARMTDQINATNIFNTIQDVNVGGQMRITSGATLRPYCEIVSGTPVRFTAARFVLEASGLIDASGAGFGWQNYTGEPPPDSYTENNYYTYAFGRGRTYNIGGGYGGNGGGYGSGGTCGSAYGFALAPFLPGSPNGCYSTPARGGGVVFLQIASQALINGQINADGEARSMYGASSGGGIWITCGDFAYGTRAHLSAIGGSNKAYSSAGGGGRICVATGLDKTEIEALAMGKIPSNIVTNPLNFIDTNTRGGYANEYDANRFIQAPDGTAFFATKDSAQQILAVVTVPHLAGNPSPACGACTYDPGDRVLCSVDLPAFRNDDDATSYAAVEYVISNRYGFFASGLTNSVSVALTNGPISLTWRFYDEQFRQHVSASPYGSVRAASNAAPLSEFSAFIREGDAFYAEAIPESDCEFLFWAGEVPYGMATNNPLVYDGGRSRDIQAIFRRTAPPATRVWERSWNNAAGAWTDPTMWSPPGTIPGKDDTVVIRRGACIATNHLEVASLILEEGGILRVAARTNPQVYTHDTPVTGSGHLPLLREKTDLEHISVKIHGDLVMTGSAQLGVGALGQEAHSSLNIGGDLRMLGTNSLLIASGPVGSRFSNATGAAQVQIGGDCIVAQRSTVCPASHYYTGGSVKFIVEGNLVVDENASFSAEKRGFGRDANMQTLAPGCGFSYYRGASYGGLGGNHFKGCYGSSNAPVQPGSVNGVYAGWEYGGGLIRIHARNVILRGSILANAASGSWTSGASGGGIWITAQRHLYVANSARLEAKGGKSNYGAYGGGGRIALARQLHSEEISSLAQTGELTGVQRVPILGIDSFQTLFPRCVIDTTPYGVTTPPQSSLGSFVFLDAMPYQTLLILR